MDEYERLIDIGDEESLSSTWSDKALEQFVSALNVYSSILKPRVRNGANKINQELSLVESLIGEIKNVLSKKGHDNSLILGAGSYKLLSDVMWKQWAILGQILRSKKETITAEGELEPEESRLEELRQLLELPLFQKIPRRRTLVNDLSEFYMTPQQDAKDPVVVKLSREWIIGVEFNGDDGGFGKIFNAKGTDGQDVVAKFVPKAPGAERELLFVNLEGVRNVIPILDSGEAGSDYVIIMPKADMSLRKFISDNSPQSLDDTKPILTDLLESLQDLDGKVVHRDIKPENVLLLDGKWCLADFGISKYAEATTASNTHKYALSAPYAGPERWNAQRATIATDVYAFGVVAYELLSGFRPFPGPGREDFREQHISGKPPRLNEVPAPLADLINETLYKAQETRPRPSNILARLSAITGQPPVIVIEALQTANSAEVDRRTEKEIEHAKFQTALDRRGLLQDSASQSLESISLALRDAITASAPSAELARGSNVSWFIKMNYAKLEFTPITTSIITDWEYAESPDIVVLATVDINLRTTKPNFGREGRSHSLWFCDAKQKGQFEWYEVAFMLSPLYQKSSSVEPFSLDPGRDAALALTPITAHVQVAWPFTPLKDDNLVEFVQRWGTWFAVTSQNGYQLPGQMPEKDTGTWRR